MSSASHERQCSGRRSHPLVHHLLGKVLCAAVSGITPQSLLAAAAMSRFALAPDRHIMTSLISLLRSSPSCFVAVGRVARAGPHHARDRIDEEWYCCPRVPGVHPTVDTPLATYADMQNQTTFPNVLCYDNNMFLRCGSIVDVIVQNASISRLQLCAQRANGNLSVHSV